MQPLTIAGRDPGGTMIAPQGRPGARALVAVLSVLSRLLPVALVCAVQLAASSAVRADPVPETMNGVPFLPIPTFEEVGLPPFTMPTGTLSTVPDAPAMPSGTGNDGTSSAALDTMLSRSWGATAEANAQSLGVNATALAATCVLESNCQNLSGVGTINGAFQMSNGTYTSTMAAALQQNPNLAANMVSGLAGKSDPATQSIAASEYLLQNAQTLQQAGIANPTVLEVRGGYNYGPQNGVAIAQAPDSALMSSVVSGLSAATLALNGVSSTTTIGQWRQSVIAKIGTAASQPVLRSS